MSDDDAKESLRRVTDFKLITVSSFDVLDSAFRTATTSGRSFYDCLYVAMAQSREAEFVTADEKLVNALGSRYPVKWLGAW